MTTSLCVLMSIFLTLKNHHEVKMWQKLQKSFRYLFVAIFYWKPHDTRVYGLQKGVCLSQFASTFSHAPETVSALQPNAQPVIFLSRQTVDELLGFSKFTA